MKIVKSTLVLISVLLAACAQETDNVGEIVEIDNSYVVLSEDLQKLKDDFNDNEGRVRLMFLSGPTCGICLRGMADLNDAFIAARQNDDRLVTFVVHVPTLGAKEEHVADTIPLLNGPRVHHYWEESGIIGSHYTDVMDVDMYVWDFWAIYGPEARWQGTLPPKPDYYEHQLGGFPREKMLDAERFAAEASIYVDRVDSSRFAKQADPEASESELFADGTIIPVVAQPRNVAVRQHIMGRGGYKNLKRIQSIRAKGSIETDSGTYDLIIEAARPNSLRRIVANGERGLPPDLEQLLRNTFEFDGLFVEWPDKGHEVEMVGMLKIGDVLAWKLSLQQANGPSWHLYVNSHGGALVRADILNDQGEPLYEIHQSEFRDTSGFMFPHRIEYFAGAGHSLAVEKIDDIEVEVTSFDIQQEPVAH